MMAASFTWAYERGLSELLASGRSVPSVLGKKSVASNFGKGDRPWIELEGYQFAVVNPVPVILTSTSLPTHIPYSLGLLAWTLRGANDVQTLAYYRKAATSFSDDGSTMCAAFGARLFGIDGSYDQIGAISERLKSDPASRRTFAAIINPSDNLSENRELPCAAGVQMFLRDGDLHWLTVMRAQQALTILPYDAFLFSALQHFVASDLDVGVGSYRHFCGTYHIYESERSLAQAIVTGGSETISLPNIPRGAAAKVAQELIALEDDIRRSVECNDMAGIAKIANARLEWEFSHTAREILLEFARTKLT